MSTIAVTRLCFPSRHGCRQARQSRSVAEPEGSPGHSADGRLRAHTRAVAVVRKTR